MRICNIIKSLESIDDNIPIDDNDSKEFEDTEKDKLINKNDNGIIDNIYFSNIKKNKNYIMLYRNDAIIIYVDTDDMPKDFNYYCNSVNNFTIFITNTIDYELNNYLMFTKLLKNVVKNSIIDIYINTCGGFVSSGVYLISAMEQCRCKIITHVPNFAASMGAVIMLFGDEMRIDDDATIMFHGVQSNCYGNIADMISNMNNLSNYDDKMLKKALDKKVITSNEFKDLKDGKDLFLLGRTVNERINSNE